MGNILGSVRENSPFLLRKRAGQRISYANHIVRFRRISFMRDNNGSNWLRCAGYKRPAVVSSIRSPDVEAAEAQQMRVPGSHPHGRSRIRASAWLAGSFACHLRAEFITLTISFKTFHVYILASSSSTKNHVHFTYQHSTSTEIQCNVRKWGGISVGVCQIRGCKHPLLLNRHHT